MSKNQKPARKQQAEKEIKAIPIPAEERGCKCETAKAIFDNLVPEYDEIVAENMGLKEELARLSKVNEELRKGIVCREISESEKKLNADIKTLQSMLRKRDERIESLEGNVEFYRTRGVWKTILYHWFGC